MHWFLSLGLDYLGKDQAHNPHNRDQKLKMECTQRLAPKFCGRVQEVELRRAAFAIAKPEPGLRCWLARQQRDWRRGRLTHEQTLLLTLAGADLDLYTPAQWRAAAHEAAAYLTGCAIRPVRSHLSQLLGFEILVLSLVGIEMKEQLRHIGTLPAQAYARVTVSPCCFGLLADLSAVLHCSCYPAVCCTHGD